MTHCFDLALNVTDLNRSVDFYAAVFDRRPDKERLGYARFTLRDPPVVLTLNARDAVRRGNQVSHFGVRWADRAAFDAMRARLNGLGLIDDEQLGVACCHSVQNKIWAKDPDGNRWEFYELVADRLPVE